jgi:hypothetical protein
MNEMKQSLLSHVANKGIEQIELLIHAAANVPSVENQVPKTYVTG